jgi:hypothetical protein
MPIILRLAVLKVGESKCTKLMKCLEVVDEMIQVCSGDDPIRTLESFST